MAARLAVADARRTARQDHLHSGIAPAAGVDAFERVLASGRRRVVISPYDLTHIVRLARNSDSRHGGTADDRRDAPTPAATATVRPELSSAYEAPATEIERRLADIWIELLGVERIGMNDNFFELGGHSLLGTRVMARIYDKFGVRLMLRDVFDAPTIRRMADRVCAAGSEGAVASSLAEDDREELVF